MSRLANQFDFEQGGMYSSYRRYDFFFSRAEEVKGRYTSSTNSTVLVAGCGWGYLVEELLGRGYDAWGCDGSAYAVAKAQEVLLPAAAARVFRADCRFSSKSTQPETGEQVDGMSEMRRNAGLKGQQKFDLIITEDVLGCLDDLETVQQALTAMRASTLTLFHLITCSKPNIPGDMDYRDPSLLWFPQTEWKTIIGNGEFVMDAETGEVL